MRDRPFRLSVFFVIGCLVLATLLTACTIPQVNATERLFRKISVDFLDDYQLPALTWEQTPVGGLSGIVYDRSRDRFYAVSDDRSDFAPARFYTLKLELDPTQPNIPQIKQVAVAAVTPLTDEDGKPFAKGTVDTEGIALSPSRTLFISSEGVARKGIPPFVREFDLQTGKWRRTLRLPASYTPAIAAGQQTQGVQDNLGLESLTISTDGSTGVEPFRLFTATEASLVQDRDETSEGQGAKSRLAHYLLEENRALFVSEQLYPLEPVPAGAVSNGLTELLAIDQGGHFLSLERSFGRDGFGVKLFQLSLGGATDISRIESLKGADRIVQPIRKQLVLDLTELGIPLDNLEGMTLGPRLPDGTQSLVMVSDNNFSPKQVTQFLLFRIKGI